ncbi:hypothetical protein EVAR_68734_1 [Eumeta japonica]|uniref:Uncharacterized protein n=1 Tax=Eumeta variegata TaxID=151549 RepID=A0A4C2AH14_EUMVA|nr:hypothetical protein EVAR_68734_1 [Eumeta japonica]
MFSYLSQVLDTIVGNRCRLLHPPKVAQGIATTSAVTSCAVTKWSVCRNAFTASMYSFVVYVYRYCYRSPACDRARKTRTLVAAAIKGHPCGGKRFKSCSKPALICDRKTELTLESHESARSVVDRSFNNQNQKRGRIEIESGNKIGFLVDSAITQHGR